MMNTYTFFMEWNGGTFISQHKSKSIELALTVWLEKIDIGMTKKQKKQLLVNIEKPIKVNELKSVWCTTSRIEKELVLINIILTNSVDTVDS